MDLRYFKISKTVFFFSIIYFLLTAAVFFKFKLQLEIVLYLAGSVIGLFLMPATDTALNTNPSPFKILLGQLIIIVASLFALTSSNSLLGQGVVLQLNLRLLVEMVTEYKRMGKLTTWLTTLDTRTQTNYLRIFVLIFAIETLIFVFL